MRGDPNACGHIIQASGGSGANRQTINFTTERVVGNGSFGVVFQATCLETGETVCPNMGTSVTRRPLFWWQQRCRWLHPGCQDLCQSAGSKPLQLHARHDMPSAISRRHPQCNACLCMASISEAYRCAGRHQEGAAG